MDKSIINRYIILLMIVISICVVTLSIDNFFIANIHFYLLIGIAVSDFIFNKSFSLLTVWIAGFVFVILSEIILYAYDSTYTWVDKFVLLANDAVLLGYCFTKPFNRNLIITQEQHHEVKSSFIFITVLVSIYSYYLYYLIPNTIQSFLLGGRSIEQEEYNILFSTFLGGYHVLPLIIAFYIIRIKHQSKWKAFILSLPVFIIEFFSGTRFRMIFTIIPFILVSDIIRLDKMGIKHIISLILVVVVMILGANYMIHTRRTGFGNYTELERDDMVLNHSHDNYLSVNICKQSSPEGTVTMMNVLHYHMQHNELTYGLSTGYILYFWIPRVVWPNKPTMLNYWLPRKYLRVGEGHSTSTGFMGEPYADFGYLAFVIYFAMGFLLRKGNNMLIKYSYGRVSVYNSLYVSILIPYVFFAVRSPVTGTCYTIMQLLVLYLFSKFFVIKK